MSHTPTTIDPRRLRIIALWMFILGIPIVILMPPWRMAEIPLPQGKVYFIGIAVWVSWLVRFVCDKLPRTVRALIWIISALWHGSFLLWMPFYMMHPALLYLGIHCCFAFGFSLKLIWDDKVPCCRSS